MTVVLVVAFLGRVFSLCLERSTVNTEGGSIHTSTMRLSNVSTQCVFLFCILVEYRKTAGPRPQIPGTDQLFLQILNWPNSEWLTLCKMQMLPRRKTRAAINR